VLISFVLIANSHRQQSINRYTCRKFPFPLVARDFLQRGIFTKIHDDKFIFVNRFIDKRWDDLYDVPIFAPSTLKENEKRIRGQITILSIFERLPFNCTMFTYIIKGDIKGSVPSVVAEAGLMGNLDLVHRAYVGERTSERVNE